MEVVTFRRTPPRIRPVLIIVTALSLGLLFLGLTLTIIGNWPGYSPYGGNPLEIVGPILLGLGVIGLIGITVHCCVQASQPHEEYEKKFSDLKKSSTSAPSQNKSYGSQYYGSSQYAGSYGGGVPMYLRPNSTRNGTPTSTVPSVDNSTQLKRTASEMNAVPAPPPPQPQPHQQGHGTQGGTQWGGHGNQQGDQQATGLEAARMEAVLNAKNLQKEAEERAAAHRNWENAQQKYNRGPAREIPVTQEPQIKKTESRPLKTSAGVPVSSSGRANGNKAKNGNAGLTDGEKPQFWGSNKKLERSDSRDSAEWKKSLPILQIPIDIGEGSQKTSDKTSKTKGNGKASTAEKENHSRSRGHSDRESRHHNEGGAKAKSSPSHRWGSKRDQSGVANEAYQAEESIPKESTPKDNAQSSSSRHQQRSHSKTRDKSHDKSHDRSHDRSHERSSSQGRNSTRHRSKSRDKKESKSRESSRGRRSSFEDLTTMNFVSGVSLEKEARKKSQTESGRHRPRGEDSRRSSGRHRSKSEDKHKQSHVNYSYDHDEAGTRRSPEDHSSASEASRRRYRQQQQQQQQQQRGYDYNPDPYQRGAGTPSSSESRKYRKPHDTSHASDTGTSMSDMLSTGTKTTTIVSPNFTININAQAGSAVQLGFGGQKFPQVAGRSTTPMIEASPVPKLNASRPIIQEHSEA